MTKKTQNYSYFLKYRLYILLVEFIIRVVCIRTSIVSICFIKTNKYFFDMKIKIAENIFLQF